MLLCWGSQQWGEIGYDFHPSVVSAVRDRLQAALFDTAREELRKFASAVEFINCEDREDPGGFLPVPAQLSTALQLIGGTSYTVDQAAM